MGSTSAGFTPLNPAHVQQFRIQGLRAALVMGVNPAGLTEMVLRGAGAKAVARA
jgi:hypothetical protein